MIHSIISVSEYLIKSTLLFALRIQFINYQLFISILCRNPITRNNPTKPGKIRFYANIFKSRASLKF